MVAPNTQVLPLQHHLKGSNASTSSRNYSRMQSEMQRDGFEVHKENFLSLSLSKNAKHSEAAEKAEGVVPSDSQMGHLHMQGASVRAELPSVLSMNPSSIAAFSSPTVLQSLAPGEEAINAYNLYAEMFPRTCMPMSTCTATSDAREICPSRPMIADRLEVVQFLPDVKCIEDGPEDNVKRLKCTTSMEDTSMGLFDKHTSKQGNTSHCVVDGSCMNATRDGLMGDMHSFVRTYKSNDYAVTIPAPQRLPNGFSSSMSWGSGVNAHSVCGTSSTAEMSKALPAVGLKLFTSSAHAQMPKALLTFSEGVPSLPLSLEHSQQQATTRLQKTPMHENSCTDADWGKFLALSATPVANNMETANMRVLPFQLRFKQLQAFLKQCDETDQNECMQALRSLSAAARSGRAVELETRAIRLSLEEGKEIKRMRLLNVLGKIQDQSLEDAGATPNGPRLPAPGATAKLKSVP